MVRSIVRGEGNTACGSLRSIRQHLLDAHDEVNFSGGGSAVSFVLDGVLLYRDGEGNYSRLLPGEMLAVSMAAPQRLSSASKKTKARLVTLEFTQYGDEPVESWARYIADDDKANALHRVATADGAGDTARLAAAAEIYWCTLEKWDTVIHLLPEGHGAVVRVFAGDLNMDDDVLHAGDSAAIIGATEIRLSGVEHCEFILIDTVVADSPEECGD